MLQLFVTGVVDTGGKFTASIGIGGKFTAGVVDTVGANISRKFLTLMLFSGAWGQMSHEKNLKQNSRDIVPFSDGQCIRWSNL